MLRWESDLQSACTTRAAYLQCKRLFLLTDPFPEAVDEMLGDMKRQWTAEQRTE